jgi:hypothetical protein
MVVEIEHRHRIICDQCGPLYDADSAEDAEAYAVHHITEDIGDEDPRPHLGHLVSITPITIVENL